MKFKKNALNIPECRLLIQSKNTITLYVIIGNDRFGLCKCLLCPYESKFFQYQKECLIIISQGQEDMLSTL